MEIGTMLRKLRDSKGLTTRHIAEKIGISHSTYVDWENDKSSPSLKFYIKLASSFQVCPVELMSYLTGHLAEPMSSEEKMSMTDMREMVSYYRNYSNLLKNDKERIEMELARIRELLVSKSIGA